MVSKQEKEMMADNKSRHEQLLSRIGMSQDDFAKLPIRVQPSQYGDARFIDEAPIKHRLVRGESEEWGEWVPTLMIQVDEQGSIFGLYPKDFAEFRIQDLDNEPMMLFAVEDYFMQLEHVGRTPDELLERESQNELEAMAKAVGKTLAESSGGTLKEIVIADSTGAVKSRLKVDSAESEAATASSSEAPKAGTNPVFNSLIDQIEAGTIQFETVGEELEALVGEAIVSLKAIARGTAGVNWGGYGGCLREGLIDLMVHYAQDEGHKIEFLSASDHRAFIIRAFKRHMEDKIIPLSDDLDRVLSILCDVMRASRSVDSFDYLAKLVDSTWFDVEYAKSGLVVDNIFNRKMLAINMQRITRQINTTHPIS